MKRSVLVRLTALFPLAVLIGCKPDLGPCDPAAARKIAYDQDGFPAYEGQALMQVSCGNGGFCHSAGASGANRFGAPAALDFDMQLASTGSALNPAGRTALALGRKHTRGWRDEVYHLVSEGEMPPTGPAGAKARQSVSEYRVNTAEDGSGGQVLAKIEAAASKKILKNWLACGAPVVERTEPSSVGTAAPVGDIVERGESSPPGANWSEIYARVIERRCVSCHSTDAPEFPDHQLDLGDIDVAYENLIGITTIGVGCEGSGAVRVVPGDPDASALLSKLSEAEPLCGGPMPDGAPMLPADVLGAIESWIEQGAENN